MIKEIYLAPAHVTAGDLFIAALIGTYSSSFAILFLVTKNLVGLCTSRWAIRVERRDV